MPACSAHDGTKLAYHVFGDGPPVVCLSGGPMQDSVYLGDLGGLSAHRGRGYLRCRGCFRPPGRYRGRRMRLSPGPPSGAAGTDVHSQSGGRRLPGDLPADLLGSALQAVP